MKSQVGRLVDWPISHEDLEGYYCEAEKLLLVLGYEPVAGAEPNQVFAGMVNP